MKKVCEMPDHDTTENLFLGIIIGLYNRAYLQPPKTPHHQELMG
jgi:hypothetical protein